MTGSTTRFKRVATVVPLALVSAAWTAHLAGAGPTVTAAGAPVPAGPAAKVTLPDGTRVAQDPIDYPASLSTPDEITATDGGFTPVASTAQAGDIPSVALAAYQRAETVINAADPGCGLSWQLIAAIGRVESDHGRFAGATLGADGKVSTPILGPVLDGRNGTAIIRDTDGGQYDGDSRYDRAVGPMQFIPSTWSVVGVDTDNDGVRDPQDIDDAALATAVYLCSGTEDLSRADGQNVAVYRYNHSFAYVRQVLAIMRSYLEGDYDAGPGSILSARTDLVEPLVPVEDATTDDDGAVAAGAPVPGTYLTGPVVTLGADAADAPIAPPTEPTEPTEPTAPVTETPTEDPTDPATGTPTDTPTDVPSETPTDTPTDEPTDTPSDEPSETPTDAPSEDPTDVPSETPGETPTEDPTEDPTPAEPEPGTLSAEDATTYCADQGLVDDPASVEDDYDTCVATYTAPEEPEPSDAPEPAAIQNKATGRKG